MELTQRPELKQKVTLSPQVYQGLSILAMPIAELELLVEAEMLENPLLEVEEPADESSSLKRSAPSLRRKRSAPGTSGSTSTTSLRPPRPTGRAIPTRRPANTEEFVGGVVSFTDYLDDQVGSPRRLRGRARVLRAPSSARWTPTASSWDSAQEIAQVAERGARHRRGGSRAWSSSSIPPGLRRATWPRRS